MRPRAGPVGSFERPGLLPLGPVSRQLFSQHVFDVAYGPSANSRGVCCRAGKLRATEINGLENLDATIVQFDPDFRAGEFAA